MSRKYYDRVLQSGGVRSQKFHSSFGASILKKFGWTEGDGLGKDNSGITDCIQIKKRKDNLGLGAETTATNGSEWTNWWDDLYNTTAKSIRLNPIPASNGDNASGTSNDEAYKGAKTATKTALIFTKQTSNDSFYNSSKDNSQYLTNDRFMRTKDKRKRKIVSGATVQDLQNNAVDASSSETDVPLCDESEQSLYSAEDQKTKKRRRTCIRCGTKIKKKDRERLRLRNGNDFYCLACPESKNAMFCVDVASRYPDMTQSLQVKKRQKKSV